MMDYKPLLIPCWSEIEKEGVTLKELLEHLLQENDETLAAAGQWMLHKNGKTLAHLFEELTDVETMCISIKTYLEREFGRPGMCNEAVHFVNAKNRLRGYHERRGKEED